MAKTKGDLTFDAQLGQFVDKHGNVPPPKKKPRTKRVDPRDFTLDTRSVYEKDLSLLGPVIHRAETGELIRPKGAGRKSLPVDPRATFRRGTRWRVVGENVRIEAMCNYGKGANGLTIWSGWSRVIPVGTELECIGWRRFGPHGTVAPQFVYPGLPAEAKWSTVWPHDGVWRPWPLAGILEQVRDD